jgi:TP901 family phage tail tape measure protein
MAVIDVTMDTAGVERGSFVLNTQLDAMADRIQKLTSVQNQYNSAGVNVGATIKGITKDGKEFTATLGLMTKAERELAAAGFDVQTSLKSIKYKETADDAVELTQATTKLREIADKLATSFRYFATYKAFNFIADGLREGVAEANKLQIEISKIRTITQGQDQQTTTKFGEDIRGVSDRTGIDVNEVARAFYDTTSNQVARGKDTAAFVETAAQLARVTGSSTVDTVNLLSSRINAFGLNAKDADKIAAEFFRTIDEGRVVASELANTIGRTDVLASNLGIAFQDVDATLAITTQKGFKTSDAMTLLTNLMIKLEKPTESTARFFKSIGAESGEAAVKIAGGLIPLMRLIVDQTKSGILPVSAFFDEIRGRKQFGIFEQSIDEIEAFSNKLKDVQTTVVTYQNAVDIRGESPADKLNKEINKLSNVFKVDFGQEILKQAAAFLEWAGGADKVTQNAKTLVEVFKVGAVVGGSFAAIMGVVTAANFLAAQSFVALGAAARTTIAIMAPVIVAYATYKATLFAMRQLGVGGQNQFTFLDVDPSALRATANAVAEIRKEYADFKKLASQKVDPFASFEESAKNMASAYRDLQGIIAKAITVNDSAFESAKTKSRETAEAMKVSFSTWADTIRNRISEFKKAVTDTKNEIEKSKKSILGFQETLDGIIFATQLKYANDEDRFGNQKQQVIAGQIEKLRSRGRELFEAGTPEGVEQARRLFAEAAKLQADLKDLRVERDRSNLERFGGPGEKTLIVDVNDLLRDQMGLKEELDSLEAKYQARQKETGRIYEKNAKVEDERLKKLMQDFDRYNKINIFDKDGSISAEFKDKRGKFDRTKLEAALSAEEAAIRRDGPTDYDARLRIEMGFLERRKALYKEAQLAQDAEELKTEQAKQLGKEEEFKASLERIKTQRQKLTDQQANEFEVFNQFPKTLAAFADLLAKSGRLKEDSAETKEIYEALLKAREASVRLENNKINVGGVLQYDPARLAEATQANKAALDTLLRIREKVSPGTLLELRDDQGQSFNIGEAKASLDRTEGKLLGTGRALRGNTEEERKLREDFDKQVKEPLDRLKKLFPELAKSGVEFTDTLNAGLKKNDEGLDSLIRKLERVQELMKNGVGRVGALPATGDGVAALTDTVGEVYAASGGIAGLFPGQPRGLDIYPIWAAKGEMIINARSAAMYKPMLEAIQSRRAPQYMANGGRVGGDTNVGDITVNVNGGSTDAQTGRNIGRGLERGIRRGTIKLNPRRN